MDAPFPPPLAANFPISGICVTAATFPNGLAGGAIDDGLNGYFSVTWTVNQPELTIFSSNVSITVANTGPGGVAQLTVPGATSGNAAAPRPSWVGKPIAIAGAGVAGGTMVAMVTKHFFDAAAAGVSTVVLSIPAPTPLTASVQQIACPCFTSGSDGTGLPAVAGKKLWIGNGGRVPQISQAAGGGGQLYWCPFAGTITSYTSPFQISMTAIPGPTQIARPGTYLEWGTDNTGAVVNGGLAAMALGQKVLFFPGHTSPVSTGRFCLFEYVNNVGVASARDFVNTGVLSALQWHTSGGATVFVTSKTDTVSGSQANGAFQGNQLYKAAIPWNAASPPAPRVTIDAPTQWPRLATLNAFVVLIVGDSWANHDPSGQSNPVWGAFIANLQKRNSGKTVYVITYGSSGLTWNALSRVIGGNATIAVDGLGNVTPDLVCLFVTGGNDGARIYRSDIQSCINTVRSWTAANGLPPDIVMLTGTYPRTFEEFSANGDERIIVHEYAAVLHRSMARRNNYAIMDVAAHASFALSGWSEDRLATITVPPPAPGTATATAPYVIPYQCRDFFMAIKLGAGTGSAFWAAAGTLQISLSPKPDNRLILSVDGSNNLIVTAVTWGMPVPTTITMNNGSAEITTGGQTEMTVTATSLPNAPNYTMSQASATYTAGMVGQCYLAAGMYYGNADFRTYVTGFTNSNIIFGCDGNAFNTTPSTLKIGGQMFIASDAPARVDCIVAGAGTVSHPLTGGNSLVTTVIAVANNHSATLAAVNSQATITAAIKNVFIGSISVKPTYNMAVLAGSDAGVGAVLTIRKSGTHVRIGYILGGATLTDIRAIIQTNEKLVWEGEVELFGGPFFPKIYAGVSSTVQVLAMQIDDREVSLRMPTMTMRDAFGGADPTYAALPYGGDSGHPSQAFIAGVLDEAAATQNLATGTTYGNNFAVVAATTSGYTIPANQAFTKLTPAGTIATCPTVLPAVFPQGGRLEIFTSQIVTSWVVSAPSGFTIDGAPVIAGAANQTIAYRLGGTIWTRVQ